MDNTPVNNSTDSMPVADVSRNSPERQVGVDSWQFVINYSDGSQFDKLHRCIKSLDTSKPTEKLFLAPEEEPPSTDESEEETFEDEVITKIIIIEKCDPVSPRVSGSEGRLTSVIATSTHTFADPKTTTPQPLDNRPRPASFAGLSNRGPRHLLNRFFHKGRSKSDGTTVGQKDQLGATSFRSSQSPGTKGKRKTQKSQKESSAKKEKMKTEATDSNQEKSSSSSPKPMFENATHEQFSKLPPLQDMIRHKPDTLKTDDTPPLHPTDDERVGLHRQESRWDQMGHAFRHAFQCMANQTDV